MQRIRKIALMIVIGITCGCAAPIALAQGSNGGILYASDFAQWSLPQGNGPAAGTIQWTSPSVCNISTQGGYSFVAPKVGRPLLIVDAVPANSETVTPTSVILNGSYCTLNATMIHTHTSYTVVSGTAGLQEAIDYRTGYAQGSLVVLTPAWTLAGGVTSMITSAYGTTLVTILDQRTSMQVAYTWNGSAYVATSLPAACAASPFSLLCGGTGATTAAGAAANIVNGQAITPSRVTASGTIQGGTVTDGTASLNSGSITGGVNGTFSGTLSAGTTVTTPKFVLGGYVTGLADLTSQSLYITNTQPTITGSVNNNVVVGTGGAGGSLAPGASNSGGDGDVIMGYGACAKATSMREAVCVGNNVAANLTGNGTGADDMIGVYIGSNAVDGLTNLGGAVVCIGQKCGESATALYNTAALGIHSITGVLRDGDGTNNTTTQGYSSFFGNNILNTASPNNLTSRLSLFGNSIMEDAVSTSTLIDDSCVGFSCFLNIDGTGLGTPGQMNSGLGSMVGGRLGKGFNNLFLGFDVGGSGACAGTITVSNNFLAVNPSAGNPTGYCLTSGTDNTLIDGGGQGLTTGGFNFMDGQYAGAGITTGSANIAIGYSPMRYVAAGLSLAVGVGQYACYVATATGQVCVGYSAGRLYTATGGTFYGHFAGGNDGGSAGKGPTTGNDVTCLGDTTCQTPTTEANLTEVGASADSAVGVHDAGEIGPGQNTVTNTLAFEGYSFVSTAGAGTFSSVSISGASALLMASTTATSATLGSNGAVPAQVAGYLSWTSGGTTIKVPYFNN